jgi:serine O-acetyltransferase
MLSKMLRIMSFSAKELIKAIQAKDPAARSAWDVILSYPGFHAVCVHALAHKFWTWQWYSVARWCSHWGRFLTGIEIHPGAVLGRRVFIDHGMGVVIGETVEIGDDCTLYQGVTLGGTTLTRGAKRHPTLEAGVVVGAGAKVLGPFTVGAGARIGSNSVVVKAVPAGATAIGIPARIIEAEEVKNSEGKFAAYGLSADMQDPMVQAVSKLISENIELKARLSKLEEHGK